MENLPLIKLLLGIKPTNNDYDTLILFYYKKIKKEIITYCNLTEFPEELNDFLIEKLANVLRYKLPNNNGGNVNQEDLINSGKIKSITRGDTRIEYNYSTSSSGESSSNDKLLTSALLTSDKEYLKKFRRVCW